MPVLAHLFAWSSGIVAWRGNELNEAAQLLRGAATGLLNIGMLPLAAFVLFDLGELAARLRLRRELITSAMASGKVAESLDRPLYTALADISWARSVGGSEPDPD